MCVCVSEREDCERAQAEISYIQMKSVITAERAGIWHWCRCVYTVRSAGVGSLPKTERREKSEGNPSLVKKAALR